MRTLVFTLLTVALSCNMLSAQNQSCAESYEMIAKVFQNQFSNQTNNISNPNIYNGIYTLKYVLKGNKKRMETTYNNCITIITRHDDGKNEIAVYYPYIKKGYTYVFNQDSQKAIEEMRKGKIEKTGKTITVLGYNCDIYKEILQNKVETPDLVSETNIINEYAVCTDIALSWPLEDFVPGLSGFWFILKSTNNCISTTKSKYVNMDSRISCATIVSSCGERNIDDSEFEIPSDIKMYDSNEAAKIMEENKNNMVKNDLWNELPADDHRFFDNLSDDWNF